VRTTITPTGERCIWLVTGNTLNGRSRVVEVVEKFDKGGARV